MACCIFPLVVEDADGAFTVDSSRVTFGRGCLAELGDRARALGLHRVALFSDAGVARPPASGRRTTRLSRGPGT